MLSQTSHDYMKMNIKTKRKRSEEGKSTNSAAVIKC